MKKDAPTSARCSENHSRLFQRATPGSRPSTAGRRDALKCAGRRLYFGTHSANLTRRFVYSAEEGTGDGGRVCSRTRAALC